MSRPPSFASCVHRTSHQILAERIRIWRVGRGSTTRSALPQRFCVVTSVSKRRVSINRGQNNRTNIPKRGTCDVSRAGRAWLDAHADGRPRSADRHDRPWPMHATPRHTCPSCVDATRRAVRHGHRGPVHPTGVRSGSVQPAGSFTIQSSASRRTRSAQIGDRIRDPSPASVSHILHCPLRSYI